METVVLKLERTLENTYVELRKLRLREVINELLEVIVLVGG